jgi:hypothetical protein
LAHLLDAVFHMPPALSQSALVVYCEKSLLLPDGLADGAVDEPLDEPGLVLLPPPDELPVPLPPAPLPDVPEGVPEPDPELPDVPLPLLDCAAARAGASATIPTKSVSISFCMVISSRYGSAG